MKTAAIFLTTLASFCVVATADFSLNRAVIAGGGGTSSNAQFSLVGTLGQPDAGGPMANGPFVITGGFWTLPMAIQIPGGPILHIVPATPGFATLSWTPATTGFVLQESTLLSPTNWINAPSLSTNPITVPAAVAQKFYRLFFSP